MGKVCSMHNADTQCIVEEREKAKRLRVFPMFKLFCFAIKSDYIYYNYNVTLEIRFSSFPRICFYDCFCFWLLEGTTSPFQTYPSYFLQRLCPVMSDHWGLYSFSSYSCLTDFLNLGAKQAKKKNTKQTKKNFFFKEWSSLQFLKFGSMLENFLITQVSFWA